MSWIDLAVLALLGTGLAFYGAGSLGLLRFPDTASRLHALTKADNLGLGLVALAAALHWGSLAVAAKIALVWLFAVIAAGTTSQLLAGKPAWTETAAIGTVTSMTAAFDIILCLMILGTAGIALFVRDALAAIAFFIAFANLLGLAWLGLDAVNVALAEIALGAGVTGILLILARARLLALGDDAACADTSAWLGVGALAACAGFVLLLAAAVLSIPPESGLDRAVAPLMPGLGIENRVTGVLLAFRAYDTLLESFVLLGALVAVWSLAPAGVWPGRPADLGMADVPMGRVAGSFGQLLLPVALVTAAYLVWAGSDMPGGAFQAGTVLAGGLMVAAMGGAISLPRSDLPGLRVALVLGPLVFLLIGLAGKAFGGFLVYPEGMAKAAIVAIEYALFLSIGATLALLVAGPNAVATAETAAGTERQSGC